MIPQSLKQSVKSLSNVHRPDGRPNVFLFSTPRSGSTWLMELIWSQPGFKYCNQPLSLLNPRVRKYLGIHDWAQLYQEDSVPTLERYFHDLCDGRLRFANPNPFRRHYRLITRRLVFKEIHGCADRINWFRDTFNARVVYLVRHPIAVTVSSEKFPLLDAFITGDFRRHFSAEQLEHARRIARSGTHLEQGVLSWCLQNAVALRQVTADWAVVTYEQLVLDPEPVIQQLADKLELPRPERMRAGLTIPSVNVKIKSNDETRRLLYQAASDGRPHLIEKWRTRVSQLEEAGAFEILDAFGIDLYRRGDVLPAEWAWVPRSPSADREVGDSAINPATG